MLLIFAADCSVCALAVSRVRKSDWKKTGVRQGWQSSLHLLAVSLKSTYFFPARLACNALCLSLVIQHTSSPHCKNLTSVEHYVACVQNVGFLSFFLFLKRTLCQFLRGITLVTLCLDTHTLGALPWEQVVLACHGVAALLLKFVSVPVRVRDCVREIHTQLCCTLQQVTYATVE